MQLSDSIRKQIFTAGVLMLAFVPGANALDKPTELVSFHEKKLSNGVELIATNAGCGHCAVTLELVLTNAVVSKASPLEMVLAPNAKSSALEIHQSVEGKAWRYTYADHYCLGDPQANHDPETPYALPYSPGAEFTVIQGFKGKFSHTGELEYAIDWAMPEGTVVCAARDGKVVKTKADSNEGGTDRAKFFDKGNFVAIEHADGTVGNYLHLMQNGATVKPGQMVKAGDPIGLSGMTGFTSRPHLHFHVQIPNNGKTFKTVPIKFKTDGGELKVLQTNESYLAPGKKPGN